MEQVINSSAVMNNLLQHRQTFREFHGPCLVSGSSSGGGAAILIPPPPTTAVSQYGVRALSSVLQCLLGKACYRSV